MVSTLMKNIVKLDHFPNFRGEHEKILETTTLPPPRSEFLWVTTNFITLTFANKNTNIVLKSLLQYILLNYRQTWKYISQ